MSWANVASAAQLAASLALILRLLVATADPITQTTDETIYERTTYIVPFSMENDSDIGGNSEGHSTYGRKAGIELCLRESARHFKVIGE